MQTDTLKYIRLEKYLNRFKVLDHLIGSTIADDLILERGGKLSLSGINFVLVLVKELLTLALSPIIAKKYSVNAHYLITKISDKKHLNKLILPVIDEFKNQAVVVATTSGTDHPYSVIQIKHTLLGSGSSVLLLARLWIRIGINLVSKRKRLDFPLRVLALFHLKLLRQVKVITFWDEFFTTNKSVKSVIVEFDRNAVSSPIVITARKFSVLTHTLVHGVINDYGYTPVLARHILCWGENQKRQLISQGVDVRKIFIVGNPIIPRRVDQPAGRNTRQYQTIGFGVNPVADELNRYYLSILQQLLSIRPETKILVKLHPSQKKDSIKWLDAQALPSNIVVRESKELSNEEYFSQIDCLLVSNSGLGNEALFYNLPVVVLAKAEVKLTGNAKVLVENGGCAAVKSGEELAALFNRFRDGDFLFQYQSKASNFMREMYAYTGEEATERTIETIRKLSI